MRLWRAAALLVSPVGAVAVVPTYDQHGGDWTLGACNSRDRQSPVNFFTKFKAPPMNRFQFYYDELFPSNITLKNDGSVFVINPPEGIGYVKYLDQQYDLVQVVIHSLSEHTFRGQQFPMEVQLLHRRKGSNRQIGVSVLFKCVGALNPPSPDAPAPTKETYVAPSITDQEWNANLQNLLLDPLPESGSASAEIPEEFNLNTLLREPGGTGTFLSYAGSQTQPPCHDQVTWFVRREVQWASLAQLKIFYDAVQRMTKNQGNFRVPMPLNDRPVTVFSAVESAVPVADDLWPLPAGPNPRDDAELDAFRTAKLAYEKNNDALDYLHGLDNRLRGASKKYSNILRRPRQNKPPPPKFNNIFNMTMMNSTRSNATVQEDQSLEAARRLFNRTMADVTNDLKASVVAAFRNAVAGVNSGHYVNTVTLPPLETQVLPWTNAPKVMALYPTAPPSPWATP